MDVEEIPHRIRQLHGARCGFEGAERQVANLQQELKGVLECGEYFVRPDLYISVGGNGEIRDIRKLTVLW